MANKKYGNWMVEMAMQNEAFVSLLNTYNKNVDRYFITNVKTKKISEQKNNSEKEAFVPTDEDIIQFLNSLR